MIHVYLAIKDAREPFPARRLENFFPTAQAPFKHDLYAIFVPGDGHCLFHSVMLAFDTCYREQRVKGKFVSRYKIVVDLRKELADKLPEYYSLINNGYTETFGRDAEIDCFKLEYMQAELRSGNYIGYGYMELISRIFDLDIYILDQSLKDIFRVLKNGNNIFLPLSRLSPIVFL